MPASRTQTFQAILGGAEGKLPSVELPFDVKAAYGAARPKVVVTVNRVLLRTTVSVYGGKSYVGFRADIRAAAGIAIGDRITVRVEPDTEERKVELPEALARALAKDKAARAAFDALPYTQRRERAEAIAGAKKPETRERRLAQILEGLKAVRPASAPRPAAGSPARPRARGARRPPAAR